MTEQKQQRELEQGLERMRAIRDALAGELETAVGRGRADRERAYRQACLACRRLVEQVERGYGAK